jgi:hypothetical protein
MGATPSSTNKACDGRRGLATGFAVACCAVTLAACGSSGKSNASGSNPGIKFADCMRSHGVQNFPDPGPGGGIQIPDGISPRSPAFLSAQRACSKVLPQGPGARAPATASQKRQLLAMAECMRRHGLSTFPDPVSTPPAPTTGFGLAFGRPGAFIAIPTTIINSPGFTHAAAACGLPGAGGQGVKTPAAGG